MGKALFVVCMLAGTAFAQPTWSRLLLNDGRVVDGQITGGDAASYFVQTPHGYFSIARANVVGVTPLSAAQPAPAPMMMPPPAPGPETSGGARARFAGIGLSVGTYILTASIALGRTKEDDDASYGLIPIVGPLLWAGKNDDDAFLKDGWDWLALSSTVVQAAGLFGVFSNKRIKDNSLVHVSPVGGRNFGGIAAVGSW